MTVFHDIFFKFKSYFTFTLFNKIFKKSISFRIYTARDRNQNI